MFYVGNDTPKLLLLVQWWQQTEPCLYVLAATTYDEPLSLGSIPLALQDVEEVKRLDQVSSCFVEYCNGRWNILFGKYSARQGGCVICFLQKLGVLDFCPWHEDTEAENPNRQRQILHLVATQHADGTANVKGYIDEFPLHCRILIFHILSEDIFAQLQPRLCWLATPFLLAARTQDAPEECCETDTLSSVFRDRNLPPAIFNHFLIRAAGPPDILNTWLQPRSLI